MLQIHVERRTVEADLTSLFPVEILASPVPSVRPSKVRRCRETQPRKSSSSRSPRPTDGAVAFISKNDTIRLKIG